MLIRLPDYKACPDDVFDAAMSADKRGTPVGELSDVDLYVRYTKYEADLVTLSKAEGGYAAGIRISTGLARDELLAELRRRHIDPVSAQAPYDLKYSSREDFERDWTPRRFRHHDGYMFAPGNGVHVFLYPSGQDGAGLPRVVYADLLTGTAMRKAERTVILTSGWHIVSAEPWEVLARSAEHAVASAVRHLTETRDAASAMLDAIGTRT